MKKEGLNKLYQRFAILFFLGTLLVIFLWPKNRPQIQENFENQTPYLPKIIAPTIVSTLTRPSEIIWNLPSTFSLTSTVSTLISTPAVVNQEYYQSLALAFKLNSNPTSIPNTPLLIFNSSTGDYSMAINQNTGWLHLTAEGEEKTPTGGSVLPAELITTTIDQLTKSLLLPKDISIQHVSTSYLKPNSERLVTVTPKEALYYQLEFNYFYKEIPIVYQGLSSITVQYNKNGKLHSLDLILPMSSLTEKIPTKIKTLEEIKETPASRFTTISLTGSNNFTLSDHTSPYTNLVITSLKVTYLYQPDVNQVTPYFLLTGTANLDQFGKANVTLGLPALSDELYYP